MAASTRRRSWRRTRCSPKASRSAPYCVIGAGVEIGRAHADRRRTRRSRGRHKLGADNLIHAYASVGDAPQDKKYKGEPTRLEIGDRNVIREFVTLNRGTTKDARRHDDRQRQPVHVLLARRARLPRRQPVRARQQRDARRARRARRLGHHGRLRGDPPVLQGRRARVPRQQRRRDARRAAVRDGGRRARPSRTASIPKASSVAASRRSRSATSATPTACCTVRACGSPTREPAARRRRSEQPEVQPLVDFIPQSTRSLVR